MKMCENNISLSEGLNIHTQLKEQWRQDATTSEVGATLQGRGYSFVKPVSTIRLVDNKQQVERQLFFLTEFIGVTLVNKIIQVSGVQFYNTSSV